VLDVLRDGYSLPFTCISLPQRAFFQNHRSIVENVEFVTHEVSRLLESGAIAEVSREDLSVCNPLGVVTNSAGKALDCGIALCYPSLVVL